jgi:DNA-binding FrmR family transcriptional regulator
MDHIKLKSEDKAAAVISLKRIIGQLQAIQLEIEEDEACDQTLTQILAARGGLARVGKDLVSKGILSCLTKYSREELERAMETMFKLS